MTTPRRKPGRPKRPDSARRDLTIIVRVDRTEKLMAQMTAKNAKLSLSDWARGRIFAGIINTEINRTRRPT